MDTQPLKNPVSYTHLFITSILKEAGYKVGLYTSPYLETFTERIRINGENIPEKDVARICLLYTSRCV